MDFLKEFIKSEAYSWSCSTVPDLEQNNKSVDDLMVFVYGKMSQVFGPGKRTELLPEMFYQKTDFKPRHLFKLSHYDNAVYGDVWVAYVGHRNPLDDTSEYHQSFVISEIDGELKVIGSITVDVDELSMKPVGWKASIYNPSDLDINNLGKFISTERYLAPKDDGFSMEDYLKDK